MTNTRPPNVALFPGASDPASPPSADGARPEDLFAPESAASLHEKVAGLEAERSRLEQEVATLKAEQQAFLERYVALEEQNSTLTTLYVASQRLQSSLDRSEVLATVREIIANLIGCEQYILFRLEPNGWLRTVDSMGVGPELCERLAPGTGLIGRAVNAGTLYLRGEGDGRNATGAEVNLTACIPLKRNGKVTGAVALFRLLPQKFELQELDSELFRLLETHVAAALYCSELQERLATGIGVTA